MTDKFNASDCTEFGRSAIERADPRRPVRLKTCALQALRILLPNEVPSDAIRLVAIRVKGENKWFRSTVREDTTTMARHLGIMSADDRRRVYDGGEVVPGMARDEGVPLDETPPTLKKWLASHSKGAFLVHVPSHVFPVVDGVVKDWNIYGDGAGAGLRRRVLAFTPCTGASVGNYIRPKREAKKHNDDIARRKEERKAIARVRKVVREELGIDVTAFGFCFCFEHHGATAYVKGAARYFHRDGPQPVIDAIVAEDSEVLEVVYREGSHRATWTEADA